MIYGCTDIDDLWFFEFLSSKNSRINTKISKCTYKNKYLIAGVGSIERKREQNRGQQLVT